MYNFSNYFFRYSFYFSSEISLKLFKPKTDFELLTALYIASCITSLAKFATTSILVSISPVAKAKIVSPSKVVWIGDIALAYPL